MCNSMLTGAVWVQGLLNGHTARIYEAFGMAKPVFPRLRYELRERCGLQSSMSSQFHGEGCRVFSSLQVIFLRPPRTFYGSARGLVMF